MNTMTKQKKRITVGKSNLGEFLIVLNDDTAPLGFVKIYGDTKEVAVKNAEEYVIKNKLPYDLS